MGGHFSGRLQPGSIKALQQRSNSICKPLRVRPIDAQLPQLIQTLFSFEVAVSRWNPCTHLWSAYSVAPQILHPSPATHICIHLFLVIFNSHELIWATCRSVLLILFFPLPPFLQSENRLRSSSFGQPKWPCLLTYSLIPHLVRCR